MALLDSFVDYLSRVLNDCFFLLGYLVSLRGDEVVDSVVFSLKDCVLVPVAIFTVQPNVSLLH